MYSTPSTAMTSTCLGDPSCDGTIERPRYFARQLVTPAELNLEARYFLDRLRRHNRMLHGWGVVCGAKVCAVGDGKTTEPWKVRITPGYLIDGFGNEVMIAIERIVDLRSAGVTVTCGDCGGDVGDPWCQDVWTSCEAGPRWLAVCHRECQVRPVRVQPTGCGCDDTSCEYSRWQDGYEVRLLDHCPDLGDPPTPEQFLASLTSPIFDCPPCPDDPCVVLAKVDVDADGTITAIDNCSCRRMVVSFASFWWRCTGTSTTVDEVSVSTKGPHVPNMKAIRLVVRGAQLHPDASVALGQGIDVAIAQVSADGATMRINADIAQDARPGPRTLSITNPDRTSVSWPEALTVSAHRSGSAERA